MLEKMMVIPSHAMLKLVLTTTFTYGVHYDP